MADKKFIVSIIIIVVLALTLCYVLFIGPTIQGYVAQRQVNAQEQTINLILDIVNENGYVVLGQGEEAVVLVKYTPEEQQTPPE